MSKSKNTQKNRQNDMSLSNEETNYHKSYLDQQVKMSEDSVNNQSKRKKVGLPAQISKMPLIPIKKEQTNPLAYKNTELQLDEMKSRSRSKSNQRPSTSINTPSGGQNVTIVDQKGNKKSVAIKKEVDQPIIKTESDNIFDTSVNIDSKARGKKPKMTGIEVDMTKEYEQSEEENVEVNKISIELIPKDSDVAKDMYAFPEFRKFKQYNPLYTYRLTANPTNESTCKLLWNKPVTIFDKVAPNYKFEFNMTNVSGIHRHAFEDGKLRYWIKLKGNEPGPSFTIDTCYSLILYQKIWEYLFMDFKEQTINIAMATKYFEIFKYINNFRAFLTGDLDLESCVASKTASRRVADKIGDDTQIYVSDMSTKVRFFKDCYNKQGIIVTVDSEEFAFEFKDFKQYCSEEFYTRAQHNMNVLSEKIPNDKRGLKSILHEYVLKKRTDEEKQKIMNRINWDERANEDNCLLHAMKMLTDSIKQKHLVDRLKNYNTMDQFEIINQILSKDGKELKLVKEAEDKVVNHVSKIKGMKLIIFWKDNSQIHAEAVKSGKLMEKAQPHIIKLMRFKCQIREFEIVDKVKEESMLSKKRAKIINIDDEKDLYA